MRGDEVDGVVRAVGPDYGVQEARILRQCLGMVVTDYELPRITPKGDRHERLGPLSKRSQRGEQDATVKAGRTLFEKEWLERSDSSSERVYEQCKRRRGQRAYGS